MGLLQPIYLCPSWALRGLCTSLDRLFVIPAKYYQNMLKTCPKCSSSKGIREVIYGMPDSDVDVSLYEIGGCCIPAEPIRYTCKSCGWEQTGILTDGLEWA